MASNLISLSDFRPQPDDALVQLIANAIAEGKITVVIGDLNGRHRVRGSHDADAVASCASTATLTREGDIWTFNYRDRAVRVLDSKGARYLAILLEHPGVEIHALDLATAEAGSITAPGSGPACTTEAGLRFHRADDHHAGPLLDAEAKRAYKIRLDDLHDELAQSEAFNDVERISRAREEIEFIGRELAGAVGLGGRDRKACSSAERARVNVTRTVRGLIKRVAQHDVELGRELEATVRTGTFCAYEPDPRAPMSWRVERGR